MAYDLVNRRWMSLNGSFFYPDSNNEANLSLNLKTVPAPHVSDNFAATASLKGVATGPKPSDTAVTGKEIR